MKYVKFIICPLAITIFLIGCGPAQSEDDIRAKVASSISVGSPKKDVIRFLEANSFTYVIDPGNLPPNGNKDSGWISASYEQKVWWTKHYTVVDFFFDKQTDLLTEYTIRSFYPRE